MTTWQNVVAERVEERERVVRGYFQSRTGGDEQFLFEREVQMHEFNSR